MIVKNGDKTGSAEGAINYLLSDRTVQPKVIKGDLDITKEICKNNPHTLKTTFGVLAFTDDESSKITDNIRDEIITAFEKTFLGNMKDRVNILWVEHNEKGNKELHYLINRIDLVSGNSFNAFPKSDNTIDLMKEFSAVINHKYGLEQVKEKSPLKTDYSNNELKGLKNKENGFHTLKEKRNIDKALQDLVKNGEIKNRDELIKFLKDNGKKLSRINDSFISIENADGRNIRLKGGIYLHNDGKDYKQVLIEHKEIKEEFSIEKSVSNLNRIIKIRDEYNIVRYQAKAHKPTFTKLASRNDLNGSGSILPIRTTQHTTQQEKTVPASPIGRIEPVQSGDSRSSTDDDQGRTRTDTGSVVSTAGAVGAQSSLDKAISQLANAKTPQQTARAQVAVAIARNALNNALASIEEQKKQQSIKRKF